MADWKQILNEADIRTARLIVELQMQDVNTLASVYADGARDQIQTDARFARRLFEDELKEIKSQFPDRHLSEVLTVKENEREESFEKAALAWNYDEDNDRIIRAPAPAPVPPVQCVACNDNHPPTNVVRAPCSHPYCRDCLENLFRSSMTDETLYPPRCCKRPIPLQDARRVLPRPLATEFSNRVEEFETQNKTYCHHPQCSTFIRPYTINGNHARCPRCQQSTCADCKNQWHYGNCPRHDALEQLLAVANENHWRRCSACHRLVELRLGCNHITCRCRFEFCYVCGEQWKTCRCATWDEARLLERGQRLAPNFMQAAQARPRNQARPVVNRPAPVLNQPAPALNRPAPALNQPAPVLNLPAPAVNRAPPPAMARPAPVLKRPAAAMDQAAPAANQAQPVGPPLQTQANHIQPQAAAMEQAVELAVEHIRINHECQHNAFHTYREYGNLLDCEMCGQQYLTWIPQCRQCLMLICVRCKNNRLRA